MAGTAARGVKLHTPDVVVNLEVRDDEVFVVDAALDGIGGFPLGTQDAVLSLLSGGFDSAVTTFMSMRRGMRAQRDARRGPGRPGARARSGCRSAPGSR